MVDYKYAELFLKDSVDKQWKIEYDGGIIVNGGQLFSQSIEITESLCSEKELRFGSCEASSLKFKVANVVRPLINEWLTVSVVPDRHEDEPLMIGRYKVASDKPTADKRYRDITAYDAMYDILNADMAAWYNSILPQKDSTVTMKEFRESFVMYFGLSEVLPKGGLVNDDMIVEKTIEITTDSSVDSDTEQSGVIAGGALSGRDVITAICGINGCFGHIGRDGNFHYIYLPQSIQGLYPADSLYPADDLYPIEPGTSRIGGGTYISCQYDDFITQEISRIQIRQEENDIGLIYGSGDNDYIIEGNFLVYGKSSEQLRRIAENIYRKITSITYRPFSCEAVGNPCFEVGDPVRLPTRYGLIETYILERTLKGIQALRDTYTSQGVERYEEAVNGVHQFILQLKGKSNVLTRTIEETRSELKDTEKGLTSVISQTAEKIRLEVSQTYETKEYAYSQYGKLTEKIELADGKIELEIKRAEASESNLHGVITSTERELTSKIELTEKNINLSLSEQIEETKEYASYAAEAVSKETGEKLKSYYTKTETASAIEIEKNRIDLSVSEKIAETKTYAEKKASAAEKNAKDDTAEKLKSYSTTSEMNSAIELEKNRIDLSVSEKITETKTYAETKASEAEAGAKKDTEEKLKSYSTTVQMESAIKVAKDSITSSVSETYETKSDAGTKYSSLSSSIQQTSSSIKSQVFQTMEIYDEEGYTIDHYGIGPPGTWDFASSPAYGDYYLDQSSGRLYRCTSSYGSWSSVKTLEKITQNLSTSIEQNTENIALKVNKNGVIAAINLSSEEAAIKADKIKLEGTVTANSRFKIKTDGSMECDKAVITNTTCTNLDVQSGNIGSFSINGEMLIAKSSVGHAYIGVAGSYNAFGAGAGSKTENDIVIAHDGYIKTNRDIDALGYVAGNKIEARSGVGGRVGVRSDAGAMQGTTDWFYGYSTAGHIMAFGDALEVLASKDLALHAGPSSNFIHLYNNTKYWGSFEAASARKYKQNVTPITDADADAVMRLVPVEFDYIETGRHSCGLIADDTYPVLPQIVGLKDGAPDSIDYIKLVPFLLKKMQMQEAEIKELKQKL